MQLAMKDRWSRFVIEQKSLDNLLRNCIPPSIGVLITALLQLLVIPLYLRKNKAKQNSNMACIQIAFKNNDFKPFSPSLSVTKRAESYHIFFPFSTWN